jgi:hypothetical protein
MFVGLYSKSSMKTIAAGAVNGINNKPRSKALVDRKKLGKSRFN